MRALLFGLIRECSTCSKEFYANVGALVDDGQTLTEDQVSSVLAHLLDLHARH